MFGRAAITLGIGPHSSVMSSFFHTKPIDWLGERLQNDLLCVERDVKP